MRQAGSRGEATLYHVPTLPGPFALAYSSTHPTSKIRPPHVKAGHGDDIFFVFGSSFWGRKYEFSIFSMHRMGIQMNTQRMTGLTVQLRKLRLLESFKVTL